jgi:4-amino-4-deoxy-L-arabinose transferase-like glycosyltransferase
LPKVSFEKIRSSVSQQPTSYLWALIVLGAVFRFCAVLLMNHTPESDELAYLEMARNAVQGKTIRDSLGFYAMYNVGYPLIVLTPTLFIFGESIFAIKIVNICINLCVIPLCWALARQVSSRQEAGFIAALLAAFYLPFAVYSGYVLKENLMIPLMLVMILFACKWLNVPSWKYVAICGLATGLLSLVGNAALILLIVLPVAAAFGRSQFTLRIGQLLVMSLLALAVSFPWMARNKEVLGTYLLNTNSGFNLYVGNNPVATGLFVSILETPKGKNWPESVREKGEIIASKILGDEAKLWIQGNPSEFVKLAFIKGLYFWKPPILHGREVKVSASETFIRSLFLLQFLFLAFLSVIAFWKLCKGPKNVTAAYLWLCIAGYTGVHMIFYVIFRYREPIMPVLMIMSAMALTDWLFPKKYKSL